MLSKGAPLNRNAALRTDLLIRAAKVGHVEAAKMLLEKPGIRVLLELPFLGPGNTMASALHVAALRGHSGIVRLLLAKPDTQINRQAAIGFTPLCLASQMGHAEVVQILLNAGADKEVTTTGGCAPLYVASRDGHAEVVQILLDAGADKEAAQSGLPSLYIASQNNHAEVVQNLLDAGADIEASASGGLTSLRIASRNGHPEVVKILLDAGADREEALMEARARADKTSASPQGPTDSFSHF